MFACACLFAERNLLDLALCFELGSGGLAALGGGAQGGPLIKAPRRPLPEPPALRGPTSPSAGPAGGGGSLPVGWQPSWSRAQQAAARRWKRALPGAPVGRGLAPPGEVSISGDVVTWAGTSYFWAPLFAEFSARLRGAGAPGLGHQAPVGLAPALICTAPGEDGFRRRVPVEFAAQPVLFEVLTNWWAQGLGEAFRADF